VGIDLAVIVTLRLILLAGTFTLFFATTTPGELCLALEWLKFPLSLRLQRQPGLQSVSLLDEEWQGIREAQKHAGPGRRDGMARDRCCGARSGGADCARHRHDHPAPWWITEAAYARGFDSPHRRPYRRLRMKAVIGSACSARWTCSLVLLLI
jgi:energy-coupling factor transporter transmembrane protein EcfT